MKQLKHMYSGAAAIAAMLYFALIPFAAMGAATPPPPVPDSPLARPISDGATQVSVGESAFNDKSLSAGGNLACASCHNKASGHADPPGTFMPLGGPNLDQQGHRSSPTLNYLNADTAFGFGPDGHPHGGFFWDGRADSRQQQANGPLFGATEMANISNDTLAAKIKQTAYYADFMRLYKVPANASSATLVQTLQLALATYQAGDSDYVLFNSKFDKFLDGTAQLTASEARGMNAFNDPRKGNCSSCHLSAVGPGGARPLFTNFSYHSLGLPRNMALKVNADPTYFDMGLCGPTRTDLSFRVDLCGMFKVPTLRNVALTAPYFHNGTAASLEQAVTFYATRDVTPALWYPLLNGVPDKFNDLPLGFRGNVVQTPPFGVPPPGGVPRLSLQDVIDIAAFLRTLTDDITAAPGNPVVAAH
jgi:cytochrome c peroxidase